VAASELEGSGPLWGIGMPSGLDAEVLVLDSDAHVGRFDGLTYRSSVEQLPAVAFFVYARVSAWCVVAVPDSVRTFAELEAFVSRAATDHGIDIGRPFPFRIVAVAHSLRWFVVGGRGDRLPSPQTSFLRERRIGPLSERNIEALGFFVPDERGIATNPNSSVHMHFVTRDADVFVGHIDDDIRLRLGGKLLLPIR
jgi:acetolactate decarboxylase